MLLFKIQPNHLMNVHYLLHVSYNAHRSRQPYSIWSGKDYLRPRLVYSTSKQIDNA